MWDINESRAHFNQSFDNQMKIYAKCSRNKEKNRQACKQAVKVATLPNDMTLPTADDILQTRPQATKLRLNEELLNHVDVFSDDNNDEIDME